MDHMTPAPLADYLKTPLAKDLGRSPDQSAVKAFTTRPGRTQQRVAISTSRWSWRRWKLRNQGHDKKGRLEWMRVWPSPGTWDSPATRNFATLRYDGSMPPAPLLLPWNWGTDGTPAWAVAQSPAGMNEDNGLIIEETDDASITIGVLGLRKPNWGEAFVLGIRTRPWLLGSPSYVPGDWVADGFVRCTPENAHLFIGRGVGFEPKRKYLTTKDEILAGVIEHAIGIVDSRIQHGPTPKPPGKPPRSRGKWSRVEHPDRDPNPGNPSPAGDVPDRYPHGTTFAHTRSNEWIDAYLDRLGLKGQERATKRLLALVMGELTTYDDGTPAGRGFRTVETGTGPDAMIETDDLLPGLTDLTSFIEGLYDANSVVVLNDEA